MANIQNCPSDCGQSVTFKEGKDLAFCSKCGARVYRNTLLSDLGGFLYVLNRRNGTSLFEINLGPEIDEETAQTFSILEL